MQLSRVAWITLFVVAVVAVALLAMNGYTGYSITLGAVGLAAAVNLIPRAT